MSDKEALVDRIYEAAVVPELWPGVLHDIAQLAGCLGGIIFTTAARGITRWTGSDEGTRFFDAFLANRAAQEDNIRLKRGIEAKHHGFFGTHQLYGRAERESSAVYTEFLLPNGWDMRPAASCRCRMAILRCSIWKGASRTDLFRRESSLN